MNYLNQLKNRKFIAFALFLLFWFFIYLKSNMITAGLKLIDDTEMLTSAIYLNNHNLFELINKVVSDHANQRFTPAYFTLLAVLSFIFRDNWSLWHSFIGLSAVFTSFFLYLTVRNIGFNTFWSVLFCFFSLIGIHSVIWLHLHNSETPGMVLLALAMYVLSVKNQTIITKSVFAVAMVLASLTKESFFAAVPAMLFLLNWFESRNTNKSLWQTVNANLPLNCSIIAFCLLNIMIVLFFVGTENIGYAGVGFDSFNFSGICKTFLDLIDRSQLLPVIILLAAALPLAVIHCNFVNNDKTLNIQLLQKFLPMFVFAVLLVVPQIFLHSKTGWLFARYLNPAVLGISVCLVAGLSIISNYVNKTVNNSLLRVLIIAITALIFLFTSYMKSIMFAYSVVSSSNSYNLTIPAVNFIKDNSSKDGKLLLIAEPATQSEFSGALYQFTEHFADRKINYIYPISLIKLYDNSYGMITTRNFKKGFAEQINNFVANPDINSMDVVIFFSGTGDEIDRIMSKHSHFIKNDFYDIIIFTKNNN